MKVWTLPALVAAGAVLACSDGPGRQRCRLADESVLAESDDARLGALALATGTDGRTLLVAWSERSGVRARTVDVKTRRAGGTRVVLEGGATALATAADGTGWKLAAVIPADPKAGGGGAVLVSLSADGESTGRIELGPAGVQSSDVSLARGPSGWIVAWHDGAPGAYAARTWTAAGGGEVPAEPGHATLSPALASDGRSVLLAWADMTSAGKALRTTVRLAPISEGGNIGAPVDVVVARIEGADPVPLVSNGMRRVIVRDEADGDGRSEYYVLDARPGAKRHRISRANGPRSPSVVECHGAIAAAAIRTFQGEYLIGFNRFDGWGKKKGGELQIYSDGVHFGEAALSCLPRGYAIAYAEEGARSRVLVNQATCTDPD